MNVEASYLLDGVAQLQIEVNELQLSKLMLYLKLLDKWNKVYSLTAITNHNDMIDLHLLDGLSILPEFDKILNVKSVLDVGSGMGVPGIILAICRPDISISVLDSNQKKTAFLQQVKIELSLPNLNVINHRVETLQCVKLFDVAISRAFADTQLFIELSKHLVTLNGIFLAMKSQKVYIEISNFEGYNAEVIELNVPHIEQKRFLTKMWRN